MSHTQQHANYFTIINSPAKAYWLGLLTADGNVHETRVNLGLKDRDHLQAFVDDLGLPCSPKDNSRKWKDGRVTPYYRVYFRSKQMVADLAKLGVVPNKTFTTVPWPGPEHLLPHYWRGLVDGDGWVREAKPGRFSIGLCGTEEIVDGFIDFVEVVTGKRNNRYPRATIYVVEYNDIEIVRAICGALYSTDERCLTRKRETALKAIEADANRRTGRDMTSFSGHTQSLSQWCVELGLPRDTIKHRLKVGWTVQAALSTPVGATGRGRPSKPERTTA